MIRDFTVATTAIFVGTYIAIMAAVVTVGVLRKNMNGNIQQESKTLEEAARPLVEYIRKYHTPMTTAIVTGVGVEILSTDIQVSFDDDWD